MNVLFNITLHVDLSETNTNQIKAVHINYQTEKEKKL